MNNDGYIKVYRSFLQWEWHDDQSMVTVFLHCLLLANWRTKRWHGQTIERGTFMTSIVNLASICGLAPNTVRSCLKRLQDTGELSVQSSRKGTVITVKNYASYQEIDNAVVQNMTHDLNNRLNNNLHTTKKERKKEVLKKSKRKVKEELPSYYTSEPVRDPSPVPATDEEIEQARQMIMKGVKTEE